MRRWAKSYKPPGRLPAVFWLYLAGTALLVVLSLLPSSVRTTFTLPGALLEAALLVALALGSNAIRWILVFIGAFASVGSLALQSGSVDLVATMWSALALAVTVLLLAPSMRRYTRDRGRFAKTQRKSTLASAKGMSETG